MKNLTLFEMEEESTPVDSTEAKAKAKPKKKAKTKSSRTKSSKPTKRKRKTAKSTDRRERLLIEDVNGDVDSLDTVAEEVPVQDVVAEKVAVQELAAGEEVAVPEKATTATSEATATDLAAAIGLAVEPAPESETPVDLPAVQSTEATLPVIENQIIRASAGTGKTYQLTSRYLRLMLLGAAPETILATTFTRKAAGEILDRIVTWLSRAASDAKSLKELSNAVGIDGLTREDCQSKLLQLTRQMHRLQIHTIDAFFMQMAMSFSLELGMTPGWSILEEGGPEANSLRNEAIGGILREESLDDLLVLVHQLSPKGEMKRGLDGMLIGRVNDAYRLFRESSTDAWDKLKVPTPLPDDVVDEIRDALHNYTDKRKTIMAAKSQDVTRIIEQNWRGFFGAGKTLVRNINEGKEKYSNAKIPPDLIELYKRFLPHLKSMILHSASAQTKATRRFLEKYHEQYRLAKEAQRLYGFDEVTELLADHTQADNMARLSFRMDTGIDHLLLDEFQDTSIPQWRAFAKLAERCTSGETGRSFFCVGDVKQAIYGWRGGSSEIFDVLDAKLPNLNRSELQDSWRSSQIIIDAVNRVFELLPNWAPDKLGRAQRAAQKWDFPTHTTNCRDLPGHFTVETSDEVWGNKDAQEEAVFRRAAERVAALSKQAAGRSIGILCRRNNKVAQMMNELQRLGVPASEEGGNYLTDSAAVELVLSLLHLTDHPADSVTAFHLASSPWGAELGLRTDECPEITFEGKNRDTGEVEDVVIKPPAGIDPKKIQALVRTVRRQLIDDGFGNTVQGLASQLRRLCNRREARRLTQLVEKAYEYQHRVETPKQMGYERQRRTSLRPAEFIRYIRETKFTDPSNATIRVMTVHQAKGLEFDIVVLPDLLGPFVEGHDTFLYRRPSIDSDIDLVCRYMGRDTGRSFLPNEFMPLFDDFEDRKARESLCVLYVAMTRAVHAMHVFLPAGMQKGMRGPKGHAGYLIKDAFAPGVAIEPATTIFEAGDRHWFQNDPKFATREEPVASPNTPKPRLAKSKVQTKNFETVAPSQLGRDQFVRLGNRLSRSGNFDKDFGSLIHLWLSQITWLCDGVPSDAELRSLAEPFEAIDVDDALAKFKAMLESEPLRDILDRDQYVQDLHSVTSRLPEDIELELRLEQPVAGRDQNQIVTGVIDRLVLVRNAGKIITAEIIDYKTEGESESATSQSHKAEQYETQMAAYRRVISTSLRVESVTTRLAFL